MTHCFFLGLLVIRHQEENDLIVEEIEHNRPEMEQPCNMMELSDICKVRLFKSLLYDIMMLYKLWSLIINAQQAL